MISLDFIQKEQDPIQKIKESDTTYVITKDTKFLARLFESKTYLIFYIIFTIYALFGDDFRQLFVSKKFDNFFYFLMSLTCIFFIADIIMGSIYSSLYRYSVLFFIDIISVCFLLFDIGPINQIFFKQMSMNVYGVLARGSRVVLISKQLYKQKQNHFITSYDYNKEQLDGQKRQNQRRNANKFRITNIDQINPDDFETLTNNINGLSFKDDTIIYDNTNKPIDKNTFLQRTRSLNRSTGDNLIIQKVQNTSQKLTYSFQIKIIVGMFILIYLLPIFWTHTYYSQLSSYKIGIKHLTTYVDIFDVNEQFDLIWQRYVDQCNQTNNDYYKFIKLELFLKDDKGYFQLIKFEGDLKNLDQIQDEYRYYELVIYTSKDKTEILVGQHYIRGIWQKKKKVNLDSWLSICRTIFFLIIIIVLGILMSRDIYRFFERPFYQLMTEVKKIHANPMTAWHQLQDDSKQLLRNQQYTEIDLLRRSLVESSKLLQKGLGEAGNEVVVQNLRFNAILDNSSISLRKDLKAKKVYSIFGFIFINDFLEQTQLLLNDVFNFVNTIAFIVHKNVQKFEGNVNKNIGENFLIVWKIQNEHAHLINDGIQQYDDNQIPFDLKKQVENSFYSFIKIILEFQIEFPKKRFKKIKENFKIQTILSLGLHLGWAIEGAIGSKHKIDVSYLSPHVNLASRITAATNQYQVPLLMSLDFVQFFCKKYRECMRIVDRVYLKGSKKDIVLYTFNMDLSKNIIFSISKQKQKLEKYTLKQFIQSEIHIELKKIYIKNSFQKNWKEIFQLYQDGKWKELRKPLQQYRKNMIDKGYSDGPSQNLFKFLAQNNFNKPQDWHGVRSLLKK